MNNLAVDHQNSQSTNMLAIEEACQLIAPVWPLDEFIAVNPWWPMIDQPMASVSATLAVRGGVQCVMPKAYFAQLWQQGAITEHHLQSAIDQTEKTSLTVDDLVAALTKKAPVVQPGLLLSGVIDRANLTQQAVPWATEIVHQLSQFCGAYFDRGQAAWKPDVDQPLYEAWRQNTIKDKGISWLMNAPNIHREFAQLPSSADDLLSVALAELAIPTTAITAYCHSLLLSINGWASWCAYLEWQARLAGESPLALMQELLAMRLAWELVLHRYFGQQTQLSHWRNALLLETKHIEQALEQQQPLWIWQQAMEIAYQSQLVDTLMSSTNQSETATAPTLQAAFCIDVRSEVFRRHLEALDSNIQTLGYAGFFGLPVSYKPSGLNYQRAQLPGLLAPVYHISEAVDAKPRRQSLSLMETWSQFKHSAPATFSFVESAGLAYLFKLLKNSVGINGDNGDAVTQTSSVEPPQLTHYCKTQQTITLADKVSMAKGILTGMGLTEQFAPVVLLVGHGSHSCNNPQKAGLDCGACGGHSGEVNSRALAHLLNDDEVRTGLAQIDIAIPETTRFIPALHNTTTDDIRLFDVERYLPEPSQTLMTIKQWLQEAGSHTAEERLKSLDGASHSSTLKKRSQDWSQVRPEWGLAGNAAFIVAPRQRTRGLDLQGRTFLHDYDSQKDIDFSVLEQIITAPMVVTNWINLQYYASVVDNEKYGSGNKVLHNVVGGSIGVFEGNGGDLRTGLSVQSLHDGENWMHQPLRLSVFIDAPQQAIMDIVNRHIHIKQLVDNEWLSLWCFTGNNCQRWYKQQWLPINE